MKNRLFYDGVKIAYHMLSPELFAIYEGASAVYSVGDGGLPDKLLATKAGKEKRLKEGWYFIVYVDEPPNKEQE